MINFELTTLRNFAIIFIYLVLFGTAAADKFKSLKTPEWFIKPFENTWIAKLPGGAAMGYWVVAIAELLLTFAFFGSIVWIGLLPFALVGSIFLFGILCLGLRLSGDFQGSANMFIYFAATLVSLFMVSRV